MSISDPLFAQRPALTPSSDPRRDVRAGRTGTRSPWAWMLLACALLGASGGVRAWQDYRFGTALKQSEAPPFPLKDLPKVLGDWRSREGTEEKLDPEVARVAGCSDHVIRTYMNRTTGVSVTLLVLYGRADEVSYHLPVTCYPAAGYGAVEMPEMREIPGDHTPALFRSEVFARGGSARVRAEVYHAFLHGGRWIPDARGSWKEFRHHPSMFKVQTQRVVAERERRNVNNPSEQFLAVLLPEIERRLSPSPSPDKTTEGTKRSRSLPDQSPR